jgi:hypothetical protein
MKKAIDLKFNRGLVWATLRDLPALERVDAEPLATRVQNFARLVSCWRILVDCRKLASNRAAIVPAWQQLLFGQLRLPEGARAAVVFDEHRIADVGQLRVRLADGQCTAVFTELRAALRWLRAVDAQQSIRGSNAPPLGAIKELLHQFALARRDADKAQLAAEFGELYRFLLDQAERLGIDPQHAIQLYRGNAARRRPKLVHSDGVKGPSRRR